MGLSGILGAADTTGVRDCRYSSFFDPLAALFRIDWVFFLAAPNSSQSPLFR
ncbi:MAG: hypothetical protein [Olavius algarvensis Gamma 1 endosymbiont]|nr:MAG: hypothetical protein [Olavius algarvensis Gamma 1 endosymbiont]